MEGSNKVQPPTHLVTKPVYPSKVVLTATPLAVGLVALGAGFVVNHFRGSNLNLLKWSLGAAAGTIAAEVAFVGYTALNLDRAEFTAPHYLYHRAYITMCKREKLEPDLAIRAFLRGAERSGMELDEYIDTYREQPDESIELKSYSSLGEWKKLIEKMDEKSAKGLATSTLAYWIQHELASQPWTPESLMRTPAEWIGDLNKLDQDFQSKLQQAAS
jgi:hypothetical protein